METTQYEVLEFILVTPWSTEDEPRRTKGPQVSQRNLTSAASARERGNFPSQPLPNPKGQMEVNQAGFSHSQIAQAKAITTLRSGKVINKDEQKKAEPLRPNSKKKGDEELEESDPKEPSPRVYKPVAHFPQSYNIPKTKRIMLIS